MDVSGWSKRQIASGFGNPKNPYRISDYFHVDEEYGTDQDLRDFIREAHNLGIRVLLDIVYTHCGPRAVFIKDHPEFFKYDEDGKIIESEWHFPALNFESQSLRTYLKTNMLYFVCDFGVDGFRCDVADSIPVDFWEEAREELEKVRPDIVIAAEFPKGTRFWHFTENHDTSNDSYDKRVEAVYGHDNQELGLAFCFALDGIPLVYNGQEICDASRHSIFSNKGAACIDWSLSEQDYAIRRSDLLRKWAKMRKDYSCLVDGSVEWLDNDRPDKVCSFKRTDGKSKDVIFIANCSPDKARVRLSDGTKYNLGPWGYIFE